MNDPRIAALAGSPGALIVVDVQRSFGDPDYIAAWGLGEEDLAAVASAVTTIAALVDDARAAGVPVVWVELCSDPAKPWRASNWLQGRGVSAPMASDEVCVIGTPGAEWFGMAPAPGEPLVQKSVYSGFHETPLRSILAGLGTEWVSVVGLTSECCVAATATDAFQYGYPVLLPSDASAAYERRIHNNALEQLALNVGVVLTSDELRDVWAQRTRPSPPIASHPSNPSTVSPAADGTALAAAAQKVPQP